MKQRLKSIGLTGLAWCVLLGAVFPAAAQQVNSLGMKFARISPGTFQMGSPSREPGRDDDEMRHQVRISRPYDIGVHEVTVGQFRAFVKATDYRTEGERDGNGAFGFDVNTGRVVQAKKYTWQNPGFPQSENHPVVNVSWNDAKAFCEWLSKKEGVPYRLPTEAEWEYACRGDSTAAFFVDMHPELLAKVANLADGTAKQRFPDWKTITPQDGYVFTSPVGQFQANTFGLHDTHGNVWEWCEDWYAEDYYAKSQEIDPRGPAEPQSYRVRRGGSWFYLPPSCRSANRFWMAPSSSGSDLGFRVLRTSIQNELGEYSRASHWLKKKSTSGVELHVRANWNMEGIPNSWDVDTIPGGMLILTNDAKQTKIIVTVTSVTKVDAHTVLSADQQRRNDGIDDLVERVRSAQITSSPAFHYFRDAKLWRIITPNKLIYGALGKSWRQDERSVLITVRLPSDAPAQTIYDARQILGATSAGSVSIDKDLLGAWAAPVTILGGHETTYLVLLPDGTFYYVPTDERYHLNDLKRTTSRQVESAVAWSLIRETNPFPLQLPPPTKGQRPPAPAEPPADVSFYETIFVGQWKVAEGKLSMAITHNSLEPKEKRQVQARLLEDGKELLYDAKLRFRRIGQGANSDSGAGTPAIPSRPSAVRPAGTDRDRGRAVGVDQPAPPRPDRGRNRGRSSSRGR